MKNVRIVEFANNGKQKRVMLFLAAAKYFLHCFQEKLIENKPTEFCTIQLDASMLFRYFELLPELKEHVGIHVHLLNTVNARVHVHQFSCGCYRYCAIPRILSHQSLHAR